MTAITRFSSILSLFCQTGVAAWLASLRNAVFRRSDANEPVAQIPHQQAIHAQRLPKVTEEGYVLDVEPYEI